MKTKTIQTAIVFLCTLFFSMSAYAQTRTITGQIVDELLEPLLGVSVVFKGKPGVGTQTDIDGKFSVKASKGDVLVFNYLGYEPKEVKIKDKDDLGVIMIEPSEAVLEEVTVIGAGTQRQVRVVGAITSVDVSQLKASYGNVSNQLAGSVGSFFIRGTSNTEEYADRVENNFIRTADESLSTFSIDVDGASYSNMRRYVNQGEMPPADAIRTEELLNYFSYNYEQPTGKDPVKISTEVGDCPWNKDHRLVRIGVKAREIPAQKLPASNFVFLIDVSGSMWGAARLDLVKASMKLLVNNLREEDRVAIVTYSGAAGEVLPSTPGSDKQKIREALDVMTAGGSTAGGAGIQLAYTIARRNFIEGGNNRIILCTDGDFNVGTSSPAELEKLIEKERQSGVFLTVLGYGMGNYKDNRMQVLAEKGNGNHAYIDNLQEANKVLVNEFGSTMYAVAKDVKLQIEFNPEHVQAYRLIGYESRLLNKEDFNDDTKDAGEMGAGHNVTAFYEVVPVGVAFTPAASVDPLKYQKTEKKEPAKYTGSPEMLTVKLRYKEPDGNKSKKIEVPLVDKGGDNVSTDFRFASAVVMFGQLLGDSQFKGNSSYDRVIELAQQGLDNDEQGYRREFVRLVKTVKGMSVDEPMSR